MKSILRIATRTATAAALGLTLFSGGPAGAESWASIGPFGAPLTNHDVISGQVNAVAVHPQNANILYLGASEGGVWKTTNGGAAWTPLTDSQLVRRQADGLNKATLTIGAVAIDPNTPETVYAGTGEPNVGCCANLIGAALGVFRSTTGGTSWSPAGVDLTRCANGAMGQAVVNRLLVVPGTPSTVFAATNLGLYKYPEDGTDCWAWLNTGLPASGNAIDLVEDPFQGSLYVAFASRGIFKSTSLSGANWTMLAGGLPTSGFGRIALAYGGRTIGFGNPLPLVYAGFDANNTYRLFKTVNGGAAWSELPSPPSDGQLSFNNAIAVGTYDSDEVYIGQVNVWKSSDGGRHGGLNNYRVTPTVTGNSWTSLSCCLADPNVNPLRRNVDVHADNHAIVFAASGSFPVSPSQLQIMYVVNDGGLIKGVVDSSGVVSWQSLTSGLAIGQAGTIGLSPGSESTTVAGYWHNGDLLTFTNSSVPTPVAGGDGFQTTIDAGNVTVYFNCNAGFGGAICRGLPPIPPFINDFRLDTIWSDNTARKQWSDPHRPGHLLRLQSGLLFRTTTANTSTATFLNTADAWQAVDPFWGKTGMTTTMAFRSRVLEEQPIYYLGTDTGQVWRGSPDVAWVKLCECGPAAVNQISPDLFQNERIFVALKGTASPGRIKQVSRSSSGTWTVTNIDTPFTTDVEVKEILSVAVDPAETSGTTVYAGTDQGMFRGHFEPQVFLPVGLKPGDGEPGGASRIVLPPRINDWTWRRSPGVPIVTVTDLEVQQNFQNHDHSGIVRAATWGRGLFELRRTSSLTAGAAPVAAAALPALPAAPAAGVQAFEIDEDGAPEPLNIEIRLAGSRNQKPSRETPFVLTAEKGKSVILEAPIEVRRDDEVLKFIGWVVSGRRPEGTHRISLTAEEASKAAAYYQVEERIPDPNAKPPHISLTATVRFVCVRGFSHELMLSWDIPDGRPPIEAWAEITGPDQHVERIGLKSFEGSQGVPMTFPKGGSVRIKVTATDANQTSATVESSVDLEACGRGGQGAP